MKAKWNFLILVLLCGNVFIENLSEAIAEITDDLESQDIDASDWELVCRLESPEPSSFSKWSAANTAEFTGDLESQDIDTSDWELVCRLESTGTSSVTPQQTTTEPWTPVPADVCGKATAQVNNRIIGGQFVEPHSWPWQILLVCANFTHYTSCGGSLISDRWVVTAAHCVSGNDFNFFVYSQCNVSLGKHYFRNWPVDPRVIRVGIKKLFIHEWYDIRRPQLGFDIALLELDKIISFSDSIRPICLPFGLQELDNNSFCYTTGWGIDDLRTNLSAVALKQLQMPVQEDDFCGFTQTAVGPIICTGSWAWRQDICMGDSGGPLACREKDGKWYLRGVASMAAYGCNSVASYTKVTGLQDWILSKISRR